MQVFFFWLSTGERLPHLILFIWSRSLWETHRIQCSHHWVCKGLASYIWVLRNDTMNQLPFYASLVVSSSRTLRLRAKTPVLELMFLLWKLRHYHAFPKRFHVYGTLGFALAHAKGPLQPGYQDVQISSISLGLGSPGARNYQDNDIVNAWLA